LNKNLSKNILKQLKSIKKDKDISFLLSKYPMIELKKSFNQFSTDYIKKKLPKNGMILYVIKNYNDIFIWMLAKDFKKSILLEDTHKKYTKILKNYNEKIAKLENTISVSRAFYYKVFKPIRKYYRTDKMKKDPLIFITDNAMEKMPFEILGKKNMLAEKHTIVYISSLISGFKKLQKVSKLVNIVGTDKKKISNYLENIAIEESGIKFEVSGKKQKGFLHLHVPLRYDNKFKKLYIGEKSFSSIKKKSDYYYIPERSFKLISKNDFSVYSSGYGISGLIINDSFIHDVNNALFVDKFYKAINNNKDIIKAFDMARNFIRTNKESKHPAYWAGIRLYLNGF